VESRTVPVIVAPLSSGLRVNILRKRIAIPSIRKKISLRLMGNALLRELFQCSAFPSFLEVHLSACDAVLNWLAVQPPAALLSSLLELLELARLQRSFKSMAYTSTSPWSTVTYTDPSGLNPVKMHRAAPELSKSPIV